MRADTQSVTLDEAADQSFAFLANPENLSRWAVGFCLAIRRQGDGWIVKTAHADIPLRMETDPIRGTIDFRMRPAPDVEAVAYSRVVPNGDGVEYIFTQLQPPGMSDAVFDAQITTLHHELEVLRGVLAARKACPA